MCIYWTGKQARIMHSVELLTLMFFLTAQLVVDFQQTDCGCGHYTCLFGATCQVTLAVRCLLPGQIQFQNPLPNVVCLPFLHKFSMCGHKSGHSVDIENNLMHLSHHLPTCLTKPGMIRLDLSFSNGITVITNKPILQKWNMTSPNLSK